VENRQRLDAQKTENEGVKKVSRLVLSAFSESLSTCLTFAQEFSTLTPQNQVYKLIGPILMKQDQEEAKHNVEKRLEWIDGEMFVLPLTLPSSEARN